jgi:hypoxanthine phosphoribosyltransferase
VERDIVRVLYSEQAIAARIAELAAEIEAVYQGEPVLLVGVLKGSVCFLADLMRRLSLPVEIDFLVVSSYGKGAVTTGAVRIVKDLAVPVEGKHVLVAEDVLDSGRTLQYLLAYLAQQKPKSLRLAAMLDKPGSHQVDVRLDFCGFPDVPDEFVVGYGLDYAERYRNLPYIGVLDPGVYSK